MSLDIPKLTLVTNQQHLSSDEYLEFLTRCMTSHLGAVQLRDKHRNPSSSLLTFGKRLHDKLKHFQIPLIINDYLELCLSLDAQGLHLGQDDGDIHYARASLGPNKLIGLSVNNLIELEHANDLPIDYVGIGSIFPTRNKPDVTTLWGLDGLAQAANLSKHPIIAIGGINENNAQAVIQAGADGIAAIDLFHQSPNPLETMNKLHHLIVRKSYA